MCTATLGDDQIIYEGRGSSEADMVNRIVLPCGEFVMMNGDDIKLVLISHLVESHTLKLLSAFFSWESGSFLLVFHE